MIDWIGAGISIASAGLGLWQASEAADAAKDQADANAAAVQASAQENRKLSYYDAGVAEDQADEIRFRTGMALTLNALAADRFISGQRARYGKSGVAVDSGTPMEVMERTLVEASQDLEMIRYNGEKAEDRARNTARRFRMLGDAGLRDAVTQAGIIMDVGQDRSQAYLLEGVTRGAGHAYDVYDNFFSPA